MKTAVIVHGMPLKEEYYNPDSPAQSNKHWIPWVQRQLILKGVLAQALEMPEPYEPVYQKWLSVFEQMKIDEETILIGHSLGGGFLIRWLSENKQKVGKVILVAPFLDPDGDEIKSDFFHFEIDPEMALRVAGIINLVSPEDDREILDSVKMIEDKVAGVKTVSLPGKGHFILSHMKTEQFPELMKELE